MNASHVGLGHMYTDTILLMILALASLFMFAFLLQKRFFLAMSVCMCSRCPPGAGSFCTFALILSEGNSPHLSQCCLARVTFHLTRAACFLLICESVAWGKHAASACLLHSFCTPASLQVPGNPVPAPAHLPALQMLPLHAQLRNEAENTICTRLCFQTRKVHPGICKTRSCEIR